MTSDHMEYAKSASVYSVFSVVKSTAHTAPRQQGSIRPLKAQHILPLPTGH